MSHLLEGWRNTWEHVRMVPHDARMDYATMDAILKWGYSRIPVYRGRRNNIVGVMLVRPATPIPTPITLRYRRLHSSSSTD